MKPFVARRHSARLDTASLARVLPQIQSLIVASRQYVVSTANLTHGWLHGNVGRVISEEIQQHEERQSAASACWRRWANGFPNKTVVDTRLAAFCT